MPHLVILYSNNLDQRADMKLLCRSLADTMLSVRDEEDKQVFPTGGTRVLAYPAPYFAIADGGTAGLAAGQGDDYAFAYLNLRMARGRSEATQKKAGELLLACAKQQLDPGVCRSTVRPDAADRRQSGAGLRRQAEQSPSSFPVAIDVLRRPDQKARRRAA